MSKRTRQQQAIAARSTLTVMGIQRIIKASGPMTVVGCLGMMQALG